VVLSVDPSAVRLIVSRWCPNRWKVSMTLGSFMTLQSLARILQLFLRKKLLVQLATSSPEVQQCREDIYRSSRKRKSLTSGVLSFATKTKSSSAWDKISSLNSANYKQLLKQTSMSNAPIESRSCRHAKLETGRKKLTWSRFRLNKTRCAVKLMRESDLSSERTLEWRQKSL